ncbi:MAG TPA: nitroreductase/quinone reductase family protein [Candidatus Acidoferrales bacterium]|jgi:hypothetical protein|nr:nitroreductase/quinone reductase family protein [Candidatus Dormibacteraeota bacterium]HEX2710642.1 nitroreductase/quinone reductase family protein [Candidatus Acidoferrales bacterium]
MTRWNEATILEFRIKGGRKVEHFGDRLLTTTGARSGSEYVTPLMYHRDGARYVVIASKMGAPP